MKIFSEDLRKATALGSKTVVEKGTGLIILASVIRELCCDIKANYPHVGPRPMGGVSSVGEGSF